VRYRWVVVLVAIGAVALAVWWSGNTLSSAERAWCSQHSADVASWTYSTALEREYSEAVASEARANRDPWATSNAAAIIQACKATYGALHGSS
jgi:hypothetical protein